MRKEIIDKLRELSDAKYKEFHSSLCPETSNIIGVRVPILRKYAKELYKEYKIDILKEIGDTYYEERLLKGMIICELKSVQTVKKCLKTFVPKINNWAVCDITCGGLKIIKKNKNEFWELIQKYLKSNSEFEIRFALVLLLDYYLDEEHIDEVLEISKNVKHDGYYVKMANAWLLSMCLVKFYDKTIDYLKNNEFDEFTYNKALQKAIESFRITEEQKDELRKMKR